MSEFYEEAKTIFRKLKSLRNNHLKANEAPSVRGLSKESRPGSVSRASGKTVSIKTAGSKLEQLVSDYFRLTETAEKAQGEHTQNRVIMKLEIKKKEILANIGEGTAKAERKVPKPKIPKKVNLDESREIRLEKVQTEPTKEFSEGLKDLSMKVQELTDKLSNNSGNEVDCLKSAVDKLKLENEKLKRNSFSSLVKENSAVLSVKGCFTDVMRKDIESIFASNAANLSVFDILIRNIDRENKRISSIEQGIKEFHRREGNSKLREEALKREKVQECLVEAENKIEELRAEEQKWREKYNEMENKLIESQKQWEIEVKELKTEKNILESEFEAISKELKALKQSENSVKTENEAKEKLILDLKQEISTYSKELKIQQEESQSQISELSSQIQYLSEEKDTLTQEVTNLKLTHSEATEQNETKNRGEIDLIQRKLEEIRAECSKIKEENSVLIDENTVLEGNNQELKEGKYKIELENTQLKENKACLQEENQNLKAEIRAIISKKEAIESKIDTLAQANYKLKEDNNQQISQNKRLIEENKDLQSNIEKTNKEIEALFNQIKTLNEQENTLKQENKHNSERINSILDENKRLQANISAFSQENRTHLEDSKTALEDNKQLKIALDSLSKAKLEQEHKLKEEIESINRENSQNIREKNDLTVELNKNKSEFALKQASLEGEINNLNGIIKESKREILSLEAKIREETEITKKSENNISALEKENKAMKSKIQEKENDVVAREEQIRGLNEYITELKHSNDTQIEGKSKEIVNLEDKIKSLKSSHSDQIASLSKEIEQNTSSLNNQIESYNKAENKHLDCIKQKEEKIKELIEDKNSTEQAKNNEIIELKEEYSNFKLDNTAVIEHLTGEINKIKEDKVSLESLITQKTRENDSKLTELLQMKDTEIEKLSQKLVSIDSILNEAKAEKDRLKQIEVTLNQEIEYLKHENSTICSKLEEKEKQIQSLKHSKETLNQEKMETEDILEQSQNKLKQALEEGKRTRIDLETSFKNQIDSKNKEIKAIKQEKDCLIAEQKGEIDRLIGENTEIRGNLKEISTFISQQTNLKLENLDFVSESKRILVEFQAEKQAEIEKLKQRIGELDDKLIFIQKECDLHKENIKEEVKKSQMLEKELNTVKKEKEEENIAKEKGVEAVENIVKEQEIAFKAGKQALSKANEELENQIKQLFTSKDSENKAFEYKIASLTKELEFSKNSLKEKETALEELKLRESSLKESLSVREQQNIALDEENSAKIASLTEHKLELEQHILSLLKDRNDSLIESFPDFWDKEIDLSLSVTALLDKENLELNSLLDNLSTIINEYSTELDAKDSQISNKIEYLEELNNKIDSVCAIFGVKSLDEIKTEDSNTLKIIFDSAEIILHPVKEKFITSLKGTISGEKYVSKGKYDCDLEEINSKYAEIEGKYSVLTKECLTKETDLCEITREIEELKEENKNNIKLEEALKQAGIVNNSIKTELDSKLSDLEAKQQKLENQVKKLENTRETLKRAVNISKVEESKLNEMLNDLITSKGGSVQEEDSISDKINKLVQVTEKSQYSPIESVLADSQAKLEGLIKQDSKLDTLNKKYAKKADDLRSSKSSLRSSANMGEIDKLSALVEKAENLSLSLKTVVKLESTSISLEFQASPTKSQYYAKYLSLLNSLGEEQKSKEKLENELSKTRKSSNLMKGANTGSKTPDSVILTKKNNEIARLTSKISTMEEYHAKNTEDMLHTIKQGVVKVLSEIPTLR